MMEFEGRKRKTVILVLEKAESRRIKIIYWIENALEGHKTTQ